MPFNTEFQHHIEPTQGTGNDKAVDPSADFAPTPERRSESGRSRPPQRRATSMRALKSQTLRFIRQHGEVTFLDLLYFLKSIDVPTDGDWAVTEDGDEAVFLWIGMSEPFCRVVLELLGDGAITVHPRPELAEDGVMPAMPVAPNGPRRPGDTTDYFRPVVLAPVPATPIERPCRNLAPWPRGARI